MDPTTLRQCHDLVENLDRYLHHHQDERLDGIWLVRLGPTTFFVIDGTGERTRISRVQGDPDKIMGSFEDRVHSWGQRTGLDPKPCIIDMSAETLLWLRDHPGTLDVVKVWLSGKMELSSIPRSIRLGKTMRKALGWSPS